MAVLLQYPQVDSSSATKKEEQSNKNSTLDVTNEFFFFLFGSITAIWHATTGCKFQCPNGAMETHLSSEAYLLDP